MERTKGSVPRTVPQIEEREVPWINMGGTFRMANGKIIKRKAKFSAKPGDIPKPFRNIIRPLDPLPTEQPLPVPVGGFEARENSVGLFDIVDANGKVVNEKPMSENEAKLVLSKLN